MVQGGQAVGQHAFAAGQRIARPGIGAREKYRARSDAVQTSLTTFGLNRAWASASGQAQVAMSASGLACSFAATASISSGSISGSSPCTLTTMASSGRPNCATASARRSVPVGWSPRVISARAMAWAACSTRASSVAMQTCAAPERAAFGRARTTMGLPAMSARGLSGRRVEAVRAGIRAMKLTADGSAGGGVVERARLALQHDGNAVAHREGQPVGAADQLGVLPVMFEAAPCTGADEDVEGGIPCPGF